MIATVKVNQHIAFVYELTSLIKFHIFLNLSMKQSLDLRCCLHLENSQETANILLFNNESLKKCKIVLKIRQDANLKYSNVTLPEAVNLKDGYHLQCYKKFSALSKCHREKMKQMQEAENELEIETIDLNDEELREDEENTADRTMRSSLRSLKSVNTAGIFPSLCLFCEKSRKKVQGQEQKLISVETKNFEEKIKQYAKWKEDNQMLTRIAQIDFTAKEIKYHSCCRLKYQKEAEISKTTKEGMQGTDTAKGFWHLEREVHQQAFDAICYILQEKVIVKNEVVFVADVSKHYHALLHEIGGVEFKDAYPSSKKLVTKIESHFKDKIAVAQSASKGAGRILYSSVMSIEDAMILHSGTIKSSNVKSKLRDVAFLLRETIMEAEVRPLPKDLTADDICKGEVDVPEIITTFLTDLICGPDYRRKKHMKTYRINSLSEDLIFAATSAKKKPKKHLQLGLFLKSLTGSRKIITLLNRMGHCVSYHTVQELETEMTYEATKNLRNTPFGMSLHSKAGTGVGWDNYDRFVETLSGKDTLHDTVGIAYQITDYQETPRVDFETEVTQSSSTTNIMPSLSTSGQTNKK